MRPGARDAQALTLTAITPPACVTPGQASLIVCKQGDGQGVITSSPPGVDCKLEWYGVWGSGPSSVVAVGDKGTILRWKGTAV